jgi:hypothetical protein
MTRELARYINGATLRITYATRADWEAGRAQAAELEFRDGTETLYSHAVPVSDLARLPVAPCGLEQEVDDDEPGFVPYSEVDLDLAKAAEYMGWAPSIVSILRDTQDAIRQAAADDNLR